ncbi:hypothetical protein [Ochrobactrum chromiisoli]|uniref:Uncharacterized protein n=1 Tax=Ochrobactrum chromiisoli TaxID=2993941 RepID=A0ABT3QSM5_9HYPH|nr:hypothetical protein [Ochrobactrum chromiisoli]MCX2698614.1 hypothetical protein [Ochrobactrum chromiisoli]
MKRDRPKILFGAMLNCEDRGAYSTMRIHLKYNSTAILEDGDPTLIKNFAQLLLRVISAIDEEHEKGAGSLYKHDHPHNVEWKNIKPFKVLLDHEISPIENQQQAALRKK